MQAGWARWAAMCIFGLMACPAAIAVAATSGTAIDWDRSPAAVIVEFARVHEMLAWNDPEPLVRIYGDGEVRVHVPRYMRGAGDYRMQLNEGELRAFLASLALDAMAADQDPPGEDADRSWSKLTVHLLSGNYHAEGTNVRLRGRDEGAPSHLRALCDADEAFDRLMADPRLQALMP